MTDPQQTPKSNRKRDISDMSGLRQCRSDADLEEMLRIEYTIGNTAGVSAMANEQQEQEQQQQQRPPFRRQNNAWRERVAQWCYDVADHLDVPREVVYIAMNILDRFIASCEVFRSDDKEEYEVAAITSLFLAIRISGTSDLKAPELLRMSRSSVQIRQVLSTGTKILGALTWEKRIPTPLSFVKAILKLLRPRLDSRTTLSLFELASYLVEISVCDQQFSHVPAPEVAAAAIIVAAKDGNNATDDETMKVITSFSLEAIGKAQQDNSRIQQLCVLLRRMYSQSEDSLQTTVPHIILDDEDDGQQVRTESRSTQVDEEIILVEAKGLSRSSGFVDLRHVTDCLSNPSKRTRLS